MVTKKDSELYDSIEAEFKAGNYDNFTTLYDKIFSKIDSNNGVIDSGVAKDIAKPTALILKNVSSISNKWVVTKTGMKRVPRDVDAGVDRKLLEVTLLYESIILNSPTAAHRELGRNREDVFQLNRHFVRERMTKDPCDTIDLFGRFADKYPKIAEYTTNPTNYNPVWDDTLKGNQSINCMSNILNMEIPITDHMIENGIPPSFFERGYQDVNYYHTLGLDAQRCISINHKKPISCAEKLGELLQSPTVILEKQGTTLGRLNHLETLSMRDNKVRESQIRFDPDRNDLFGIVLKSLIYTSLAAPRTRVAKSILKRTSTSERLLDDTIRKRGIRMLSDHKPCDADGTDCVSLVLQAYAARLSSTNEVAKTDKDILELVSSDVNHIKGLIKTHWVHASGLKSKDIYIKQTPEQLKFTAEHILPELLPPRVPFGSQTTGNVEFITEFATQSGDNDVRQEVNIILRRVFEEPKMLSKLAVEAERDEDAPILKLYTKLTGKKFVLPPASNETRKSFDEKCFEDADVFDEIKYIREIRDKGTGNVLQKPESFPGLAGVYDLHIDEDWDDDTYDRYITLVHLLWGKADRRSSRAGFVIKKYSEEGKERTWQKILDSVSNVPSGLTDIINGPPEGRHSLRKGYKTTYKDKPAYVRVTLEPFDAEMGNYNNSIRRYLENQGGDFRVHFTYLDDKGNYMNDEQGHRISKSVPFMTLLKEMPKSMKNMLMKDHPNTFNPLQNTFNYMNQQSRETSTFKVMISNKPYDILRATNCQSWDSCMKLPGAGAPLHTNIDYGSYIAYMTKDNPYQHKWLARLFMHPCYDRTDKKCLVVQNRLTHYSTKPRYWHMLHDAVKMILFKNDVNTKCKTACSKHMWTNMRAYIPFDDPHPNGHARYWDNSNIENVTPETRDRVLTSRMKRSTDKNIDNFIRRVEEVF